MSRTLLPFERQLSMTGVVIDVSKVPTSSRLTSNKSADGRDARSVLPPRHRDSRFAEKFQKSRELALSSEPNATTA
jgi:hypothetical protein